MRQLALVPLILLTGVALRATVLLPADFREVVLGSHVIVYGRVIDMQPSWSEDRRSISTLVTIQAGTYLKGGPGETATFRVPGGTIGRYRSVLIGAPQFQEGDEAVFFLRGDGPEAGGIFGLTQGLFRVREEAGTGRRMVMPAPTAKGDQPERVVRGAPDRKMVGLDEFAQQVRAIMTQAGGAR